MISRRERSMPTPNDIRPRQRQFAPKTRTGCKTCRWAPPTIRAYQVTTDQCRERRVKCDEARPHCHRCKSTGRLCNGYEKFRVAEPSASAAGEIVLRWVDPPSQIPTIDLKEQECLYNFRDIMLDSSCSTWDVELWQRLVIPMSVTEQVVRHAVIALGASSRPNQDHNAYALRQYGLALKSLQERISRQDSPPHHLILVTCLLFVSIEFVQQGWEQAQFHLNGGLSIVKEIQQKAGGANRTSSSKNDIAALENVFGRLDNQMSLFTQTRVQLHHAISNGRMSYLPAELHFKTIEDAGKLQALQISAMRELVVEITSQRSMPIGITAANYVELEVQQGRQLVSLERWHTAMRGFMPGLTNAPDVRLAKSLLMSYLCCKMMVSNALSDGREVYHDKFLPEFEQILALATEIAPTTIGRKRFSLDTGIVAPLYWVVLKCRDPEVRRRAIALLESLNSQEGAWVSSRLAVLGSQVMRLEEQGLDDPQSAADIPEQTRLWRAYHELDSGDNILHCMRRAWESNGEWLQYEVHVDNS